MIQINTRLKITNLIIVAFVFLTSALIAQVDWDHPALEIDKSDGLPSTYIKDFEEDEFGFIWISTYMGICRFDGSTLECLQDSILPKDGFTDIAYDKKRKKLWIGAFSGLYTFDLITEEVSKYSIKTTLEGLEITSICLNEENVWVGTRSGLTRFNFEKKSLELVDINVDRAEKSQVYLNSIRVIYPDPIRKDRLWISTNGGVLKYYWKENKFVFANPEIGNDARLLINQIYAAPNSPYLYFGTDRNIQNVCDYNYLVYNAETNQFIRSLSFNENWGNRTITTYQDSLIFFSTSAGLVIYNQNTNTVKKTLLHKADGSSPYQVRFIDSKSNIWVGHTEKIRMYNTRSNYGKTYYYNAAFPGWYHVPTDVFIDEEKIQMTVFGGEGLYEFDLKESKWHTYPAYNKERKSFKTDYVSIVDTEKAGRLILASSGNYQIGETGEMVKSDFQFDNVRSIYRGFLDSEQNLWTCVAGKVMIKIDLDTKEIDTFTNKIYFSPNYTGASVFFEDSKSNVWIGGYRKGFNCYERSTGQVHFFSFPENLNGELITNFDEKAGKIWCQSNKGMVFKMNIENLEGGIIEVVDLETQIENGEIQLLNDEKFRTENCTGGAFDRSGRFWFITEKGICCYNPDESTVELFDESVGLIVNDPEMNVFVADGLSLLSDGRMVYTLRKGICLFDPETISNQKETPRAYIASMNINNQTLKEDTSSLFKSFYQLRPRENFIGFDFSALTFTNPLKTKFNYKLVGVDEGWKDPGKKRFVSYTQLKGGTYQFLLKAADGSGLWQEIPAQVTLRIARFWYQTAWAKGLFLASLIFGVFYSYFNILFRAIEKEHLKTAYERDLAELKMQALTAQMNPHFIFNSLNSIDFYIIKNDTKKASRYLNRFSRLMRLILKNSRSNYITLRDDLDALKLYLEIEALRFNYQFEYEVHVSEAIDEDYIKIPPMLIQPYVENAIWHGLLHKKENGKISINFQLDQKKEILKCIVVDNGIGRKKSMATKTKEIHQQKTKSFGMNITRDKIEAINFLHDMEAEVKVIDLYDESEVGIGTKVELQIPI